MSTWTESARLAEVILPDIGWSEKSERSQRPERYSSGAMQLVRRASQAKLLASMTFRVAPAA